jgi:glycosyltransferase involved in cell wall biosynthesis
LDTQHSYSDLEGKSRSNKKNRDYHESGMNKVSAIPESAPRKVRLAVVVSHPIPAFSPQYVSWASLPNVDLRVFFASSEGLREYFDDQFEEKVKWDALVLEFPHEFIAGAEQRRISEHMDAKGLDIHLDRFDPNIVLIYGYGQAVSRRAMRWARRQGADILMFADTEGRSHRSWVRRLAKKVVLPSLLKQVTLFLTVGDACEDYFRTHGVPDDRFIRCAFPVDCALFESRRGRNGQGRQQARGLLNVPAHHKVILNVGKLVPRKRQQDLVKLSNQLQGQREDVTVVLVGTGPDEAGLRRLCRREGPGGVIFTGLVQPHRVVDYYHSADVYVACSSRDAHSYAISEAIYAGLPIVVSDRCGSYGPSDDVRSGLNGFVYPCANVSELSKRLLHLFDTPGLIASMSAASATIGRHNQGLAHGGALVQALNVLDSVSKSASP